MQFIRHEHNSKKPFDPSKLYPKINFDNLLYPSLKDC